MTVTPLLKLETTVTETITRHPLNFYESPSWFTTELLRHVRLWPLDADTTRLYGAVYLELRRLGRVLSQVDMLLAAIARQHKLIVLTTDRDFEALAGLRIENWAG